MMTMMMTITRIIIRMMTNVIIAKIMMTITVATIIMMMKTPRQMGRSTGVNILHLPPQLTFPGAMPLGGMSENVLVN